MALAAFGKYPLESGQTKRVCLTISARSMRTLGRDYVWRVEPGEFRLILAYDSEHPIESKAFTVK